MSQRQVEREQIASWIGFAVTVLAFAAVGCASTPSSAPGQVAAARAEATEADSASEPGPFRWSSASIPPIRVTPLDHRGEPTPCVAESAERACDVEVNADGEVIFRSRSWAVAGVLGPGLSLRRPHGEQPVFALDSNGHLVGLGPFQVPGAAQVLWCRLTDEPALYCHHEVRASVADRVWNEANCSAEFVARVDGGTVNVSFPAYPDEPPSVAALVEPPPTHDSAKALALFLLAMASVDFDTDYHTPYVSDPQSPD